MKLRHALLLPALLLGAPPCRAADAPPPIEDRLNAKADYGWFLHDRFGMFIHFGLYSSAARQEWAMSDEKLSADAYRKYFDHFDPDLFNARAWARAAREAGMKYVVLTTKHHEGFTLFDSKLTDFKITNTPFHRDLVREYVEAARAEGLRIGFYYSLLDWHHPDFPIDAYHPMRDDLAFRAAAAGRDIRKYAAYVRGQVRELLTNYGQIDYLWFDFSYDFKDWGWSHGKGAKDWESEKLLAMIHELQPRIIVNNRLGLDGGGVITPEQYQPKGAPLGRTLRLEEECNTLNGAWGYDRDNATWKSPEMLAQLLIDAVGKGANLLLNVGPDGRGAFDARAQERLASLGAWLRVNGRAIYGAGQSAFVPPNGTLYTQRGNRLYLHLLTYPVGTLDLPGLAGKVEYAQLLHDGSEIPMAEGAPNAAAAAADPQSVPQGAIRIKLPAVRPDVLVPAVELFLKP